jgi:hypothetical protein
MPEYERENVIYSEEDKRTFVSSLNGNGFSISADKANECRQLIVLGKNITSAVADVAVTHIVYDEKNNSTRITFSEDWKEVRLQ